MVTTNRRCCRRFALGLLRGSRISKLFMTYRMTTLTDREISLTRCDFKERIFTCSTPCGIADILQEVRLRLVSASNRNDFPHEFFVSSAFTDGCGLLQWRRNFSRNDFSVGKHHFLPSTSTFFIPTPALAVGDLYHLLLDGLTRFRVCRCSFGGYCYEATARSTSIMKPLVWTYRTRSGDSKPSSAFTGCNLTKSIASLCNLWRLKNDQQESSQAPRIKV